MRAAEVHWPVARDRWAVAKCDLRGRFDDGSNTNPDAEALALGFSDVPAPWPVPMTFGPLPAGLAVQSVMVLERPGPSAQLVLASPGTWITEPHQISIQVAEIGPASAPGDGLPAYGRVNGFDAFGRTWPDGTATLLLARDGVLIRMTNSTLSMDDLLRVAEAIRPAPDLSNRTTWPDSTALAR